MKEEEKQREREKRERELKEEEKQREDQQTSVCIHKWRDTLQRTIWRFNEKRQFSTFFCSSIFIIDCFKFDLCVSVLSIVSKDNLFSK